MLEIIGELPPENLPALNQMTSELQSIYNMLGVSWQEIVTEVMALPDSFANSTMECWKNNIKIAKKNGIILLPEQFAQMFTDANFNKG